MQQIQKLKHSETRTRLDGMEGNAAGRTGRLICNAQYENKQIALN